MSAVFTHWKFLCQFNSRCRTLDKVRRDFGVVESSEDVREREHAREMIRQAVYPVSYREPIVDMNTRLRGGVP